MKIIHAPVGTVGVNELVPGQVVKVVASSLSPDKYMPEKRQDLTATAFMVLNPTHLQGGMFMADLATGSLVQIFPDMAFIIVKAQVQIGGAE